jgi:parallel beta-helix repeat protein
MPVPAASFRGPVRTRRREMYNQCAFRLCPRTLTVRIVILVFSIMAFLALGDGRAVASHVSCGQTITTNTKLDADLTNCPGDGIVIGADNITLDLNGHTIDGVESGGPVCEPPFPEDNGIENPEGHDGVTIKNGTIQEFGRGIAGGYGRSKLLDLTIRNNITTGIEIGSGTVEDSKDDNAIERDVVTGYGCGGIAVVDGDNSSIKSTRVTDTQGAGNGIVLIAAKNSVVEGNSISGNEQNGIVMFDDSDNNRIERNTLSDNFEGISVFTDSGQELIKNNSASGGDDGVLLIGTDHNVVTGNTLSHSRLTGVAVISSDDNQIASNSITANGDGSEAGIHVLVDPESPADTSDRNLLSGNTLVGNDGDGILVDNRQTGTVIDGNRSDSNSDDGIDVDARATTLRMNTANNNGDLGIEAVKGVKDGGGNTARGNGNPAQCVNVRCR